LLLVLAISGHLALLVHPLLALLTLLAGLAVLLALLAPLSGLLTLLPRLAALLALLPLLAGLLSLLPLLTLLIAAELAGVVPAQLLHLLLQLLGFAPQHLLLIALLRGLRLVAALLLGEFLLALRKLLQLLHRLIDFALPGVGGLRLAAAGFVLILFGIEFEIEQALQVAHGAIAAASAAAPAALLAVAERHLDIAEG
jgi:hypothetical protein